MPLVMPSIVDGQPTAAFRCVSDSGAVRGSCIFYRWIGCKRAACIEAACGAISSPKHVSIRRCRSARRISTGAAFQALIMRRVAAFAVLALAALVCADEEAGGGKRRRRKRPGGAAGGAPGKAAALAAKRRRPARLDAGQGAPPTPPARGGNFAGKGGKGGKRAGRPDPEAMVGLLKAYKEANGHVNVPLDHTAELEGREKPVRLGRWLAAVRKNAAKVKPERVAALDAVDPKWRGD